jgi:hypothetical protein
MGLTVRALGSSVPVTVAAVRVFMSMAAVPSRRAVKVGGRVVDSALSRRHPRMHMGNRRQRTGRKAHDHQE